MVYSDRSELDLSDEAIRIQHFPLLLKTAENYRNCYVAEKRIISKLSKISLPNFNSKNWRFDWRLCQMFTSLSFIFSKK